MICDMNIKPVRPSDTNGATEVKRTGTEFSAVDFKEAIYKKVNWSGKITPRQLTFTSWNT